MKIAPKIRGFICATSHPTGCRRAVEEQIEFVKEKGSFPVKKNVLIIGASMGYGLSSRITLAFGGGASTIGVIFDRPPTEGRTGSAGWYNTAAVEEFAKKDGLYAKSINGDAFSLEIKRRTLELVKKDLGKLDLVIYSLAAPRRTLEDGTIVNSVLKTIGQPYTNKNIDLKTNEVGEITVPVATEKEIGDTVSVMGGEDWLEWITALKKENLLSDDFTTIAYSYIGSKITHPLYFDGAIGMAKKHLCDTAERLKSSGVNAIVAINKALVTQSSAAIPVVPLYISILYKVMKESGLHEGCIEQMDRLFRTKIGARDENGWIRMDDNEMREDIQAKVAEIWSEITSDNIAKFADLDGYQREFHKLFGFDFDNVDYDADVDEMVKIPSID